VQVNFANKRLGGGVLRLGCVQEEIRFLICPELIVAILLCENMSSNESVVITGVERFSNYNSFARNFMFAGDYEVIG